MVIVCSSATIHSNTRARMENITNVYIGKVWRVRQPKAKKIEIKHQVCFANDDFMSFLVCFVLFCCCIIMIIVYIVSGKKTTVVSSFLLLRFFFFLFSRFLGFPLLSFCSPARFFLLFAFYHYCCCCYCTSHQGIHLFKWNINRNKQSARTLKYFYLYWKL